MEVEGELAVAHVVVGVAEARAARRGSTVAAQGLRVAVLRHEGVPSAAQRFRLGSSKEPSDQAGANIL